MIKSGKYRHRVQIQERIDTQDPTTGVITASWQTFVLGVKPLLAVPAEVLEGPGRELHAAGTKLAETTARIQMRWFPGLTEAMRILWDGKTFDIISIERDSTGRREYRLRCKDGVSDGG